MPDLVGVFPPLCHLAVKFGIGFEAHIIYETERRLYVTLHVFLTTKANVCDTNFFFPLSVDLFYPQARQRTRHNGEIKYTSRKGKIGT